MPRSESIEVLLPDESDPEFRALPPKVRRQVRVWARRIQSIWGARSIAAAIRKLSRKTGASHTTCIRAYYKVRRANGHWRALISKREIGTGVRTLRVPVPIGKLQISVSACSAEAVVIQIRRLS